MNELQHKLHQKMNELYQNLMKLEWRKIIIIGEEITDGLMINLKKLKESSNKNIETDMMTLTISE